MGAKTTRTSTFDVSGRVIWVAGAGTRLGGEVAALFESLGAKVVATDSPGVQIGDAYTTAACDLLLTETFDDVLAACDQLGGVYAFVNCSFSSQARDVLKTAESDWRAEFDRVLKGAFRGSQAAARSMIDHGRGGSIINVGSIDSEVHFSDNVVDSAAHGGLNAMTRSMALALAPHGIRANVIASTRTTAAGQQLESPLKVSDPDASIASTAVFLACRAASFITGSVVVVDGGRMASL